MPNPFIGEVRLADSLVDKPHDQIDLPKPVTGLAEPASTDAAALLSIATDTPFDVERYRQAYMQNGLSTEWQGMEDMWRTSVAGPARERIEKMISGRALKHGINFQPVTDKEVMDAVATFAETKDDGMLHQVARRLASEPMNPNADLNEAQVREVVTNSIDLYLAGEKQVTQRMRDAVEAAYLNTDADMTSLIGGMVAQVFLPTDIYAAGSLRNALMNEDGTIKNASSAHTIQVLKEYIADASPEEKEKIAQRLVDWSRKNTTVISDWQIANLLGQLDNGKLLEHGDPDSKLDYSLNLLSDAADYFYLIRPIKWLASMGKSSMEALPKTLRLANLTNRRRSSSILRGLMEGAKNNQTLKQWGLHTEEVVATQLPKPSVGTIANIPGGVLEDAARVRALQEEVSALDAATRAPIYEEAEVLTAAERVAKEVEQAWSPRLRVNLSSLGFTSDRAGVAFNLMLGRDEMHGFVSARTAASYAKKIDDTGANVRIMRVDPKTQGLVEAYPGSRIAKSDPFDLPPDYGEFYVELKHKYQLHPMDKALFDDDAVLAPTWLGRSMKWLLPPSSILKPEFANKFIANFLTEGAIQDSLGSIVRPLFKELSPAERAHVGEMWSWTEEFGRNMNRTPTWDELRQAHLDVTDKELLGWWRVKQFYDTVYHLNNQRLHRDWNARGFKTLYKGGVRYHGKPLTVPETRSHVQQGFVTVFDPERNKPFVIRNKDLERIYERGMSVLKLETPIESSPRNFHSLILSRPHTGWTLKNLDQSVLKYIPGYYPRIYEDFYYIKRVGKGSRVDGRVEDFEDTVAVASSEKEGQRMVDHLIATRGDDAETYKLASDVRLRTRDSTAADLERMRIEGRLFFDERNAKKLYNVNGNPADIVDPINAINRTIRMTARQMSTEDLVRAQKQAWKNTYGEAIRGLNVDTDTSVVVGDKLNELIKTSPKAERARLIQARAMWDHIRLIEGSSGEGATWFRGAAIQSAEFLNNVRGIGGNKVTLSLMRNAHKVAPVEWMKNLAFFDFLVTRPGRQLILQGSQHLFLAPLSPTYLGKWQLDTTSVLQGLKREGLVKAGLKNVSDAQSNRNARLMGLSRDEYDLLIDEIRKSGIVQTVNVHSYAGDLPKKIESTRYSSAARFAEGALKYGTLRPVRRGLEKYGFELGEQYNVVSSYMMALRLYKEANKITKLTDIPSKGWEDIRTTASQYSLAMHRSNSSAYQYGLLSLPLQFLQFTHKVFLTYLRAIPGLDKLGNKAFTPAQARKILLGQMIMFGGSSFGIRPEVEAWLDREGFSDLPDTVKDLVAGGSVDWMLNKMVELASGDPDLKWAFGDVLAPGGNMINLVREMVQTIAEQPAIVTALGPSYVTASRVVEGVMMAREIWSSHLFEESTPEDRALMGIEAVMAGGMSGYNDFMKARMAMKMGFWMSQSGHQTEIEAKWGQAVVKSGLGLSPLQVIDASNLRYDTQQELKALDEVAQTSYERMYRITALFGDNGDRQRFLNDVRTEQALLQVLDPHEMQYVWKKWQSIERDNPTRKPLADIIGEAIGAGYSGEELRSRVATTHALDHDEQARAQLLELLDRASQDIDWTNREIKESTEMEIENVKNLTEKEE